MSSAGRYSGRMMTLANAKKRSEEVLHLIAPHCLRCEVAGSVRRKRDECDDIDIVYISNGDSLWSFLLSYIHNSHGEAIWQNPLGITSDDFEPLECDATLVIALRDCKVHLFRADRSNFGSRLLRYTGPLKHNRYLYQHAKTMGYHWDPDSGLQRPGQTLLGRTEHEIYTALGLSFIGPEQRDDRGIERCATDLVGAQGL